LIQRAEFPPCAPSITPPIVKIEEKGMSVFRGRSLVLALRFSPGQSLSLVLEQVLAGSDRGERKNASSVNEGRTYNDASHDPSLFGCCSVTVQQ
jgi:hypothetical protein